ncbi:TPM domain-containing protein [Leptobacterium flavescens]|uniref:TPM domain-containing protein n=1 Tax=Leptobacterium flavescens TaxID=472055 RepID=A0A6P0UPK1_9FLAO|nr:TPM domain-containing protein [Leptobacterium flavescens]NER15095.1 TPM domain-containing protein [Leptobacterium flavescens]
MKTGTKILILFLALNLLSFKGIAQETETKASSTIEFDFSRVEKFRNTKLKGQIVNDYDSIFSPGQRKELSDILYDYNLKTTRQIVVVTIHSIKPYSDIQKMATDLGNYWGIGTAEKDNGLVILLSKPERKIGISTGSGTQLILTDEICKSVIDNIMIPEFRKEKYYDGIKNGVIELIAKWEQ